MVDCKEAGRNNALEKLKKPEVQEQLAKILSTYFFDLHEILTIATVQSAGVRPEGLSNEIYSCFHHIARGLCIPGANIERELISAEKSHIKRAILDSYKITINSILREDEALREILDYLVLAEDFARYIPDGMAKVNEIKDVSRKVKLSYGEAKRFEARAEFDKAIESYNEALKQGTNLLDLLEIFTKDKVYLLACSREVAKDKESKKNRRVVIIAALLGAVFSAIFTTAASNYFTSHSTTISKSNETVSATAAPASIPDLKSVNEGGAAKPPAGIN